MTYKYKLAHSDRWLIGKMKSDFQKTVKMYKNTENDRDEV